MSGTNTNIEMDDVLSSIRRLVSEEDEKLPVPEPDVQDRFILTPALRVTDVVAAPDKVEPAVPADDTPSTVESAEPTEVLTAAAVVAKATEVQQDTLKIPPAPEKSDSPEFDAMENAWREELARVAATQESGNEENDQARSEEAGDTSLEAQIAELEDAVGQAKDDWEPDGSEPEAKEIPRRHIFEVVSDTDDVTDEISEDQADEQIPVFAHTSEPHPKPYLLSASDPEQGGGMRPS